MAFESKYMNKPVEKKAELRISLSPQGKIVSETKKVPKYALMRFGKDLQIIGTEVFFEGKLFYPCVHVNKGPHGWQLTIPDFMIIEELFFWNPVLKREETELDLQTYFRTIDVERWRYYISELNEVGFEAVKVAIAHFINFLKNQGDYIND